MGEEVEPRKNLFLQTLNMLQTLTLRGVKMEDKNEKTSN